MGTAGATNKVATQKEAVSAAERSAAAERTEREEQEAQVATVRQVAPSQEGQDRDAGGLRPTGGAGQLVGGSQRHFHRGRTPHYHECGDSEGSARQERADRSLQQPSNRL